MSGEDFADFDAAFAARREGRAANGPRGPLTARLYGERWDLGYALPAAAALHVARLTREGALNHLDLSQPLVTAEILTLASEAIPAPVLNEWLARGIDTDELGDITMWAIGRHIHRDQQRQGEATAPKTGASTSPETSFDTGPSSKPTSPESTGSTSSTAGGSTA